MKHIAFLASIAVAGLVSTAPVYADTTNCACSLENSNLVSGNINKVSGDVLMTGTTGFEIVKAGAKFGLQDRLMVGPKSSATVSFGSHCLLQVKQNSDVEFVNGVDALCVKVSSNETLSSGATTQEGNGNYNVGRFIWLGAAAGAAAGVGDVQNSP